MWKERSPRRSVQISVYLRSIDTPGLTGQTQVAVCREQIRPTDGLVFISVCFCEVVLEHYRFEGFGFPNCVSKIIDDGFSHNVPFLCMYMCMQTRHTRTKQAYPVIYINTKL